MNYTVVIVTYNRLALLKECLACVDNQEVKFDNVVIVDNKCTDGTTDYLKGLVDKYHIIFEPENGGGAKGFRDGVEYAHVNLNTDWILLIDDDAMLAPNYLKVISEGITMHSDCKAFSGTVMTDGVIDITHRKTLRLGKTFDIVPVPKDAYEEACFEYDLSSFCGLVFDSHLIDKIGYPRADYFIWYDDSEYSLRIRKESKIININSTFINHKTKISTGSIVLNWRGYYGIRNEGDVIMHYGTKDQFRRFESRIKIAQWKNSLFYFFTRNSTYKFNASLYKDAMNDLKESKFGFNAKYHP